MDHGRSWDQWQAWEWHVVARLTTRIGNAHVFVRAQRDLCPVVRWHWPEMSNPQRHGWLICFMVWNSAISTIVVDPAEIYLSCGWYTLKITNDYASFQQRANQCKCKVSNPNSPSKIAKIWLRLDRYLFKRLYFMTKTWSTLCKGDVLSKVTNSMTSFLFWVSFARLQEVIGAGADIKNTTLQTDLHCISTYLFCWWLLWDYR